MSVDSYALKQLDLEPHLQHIDEVIAQHNFEPNQLEYFEFLKNLNSTNYYSYNNIEKGMIYLEKCVNSLAADGPIRSVYWINKILDQMTIYLPNYLEECEAFLTQLVSSKEILLAHRTDLESTLHTIHEDNISVGILVRRGQATEALEKIHKLLKLLDSANVEHFTHLNYRIAFLLLLFVITPEDVDQAETFRLKKDFLSLENFVDTDRSFILDYAVIGLFGTLCHVFNAMGIILPIKALTKILDHFKPQRLTYLSMMSSFESYNADELKPYTEEAIRIAGEEDLNDLHSFKLSFKLQDILLSANNPDEISQRLAIDNLKEMIKLLKEHKGKYDYIDGKLVHCYQILTP